MRQWTEDTDREADILYRTFTDSRIRQYQDIVTEQIRLAYADRKEDALADLQNMHNALTREMLRRCST